MDPVLDNNHSVFLQLTLHRGIPYEGMHNATKNAFVQAVQDAAAQYLANPSDNHLLRILALPKAGLASTIKITRRRLNHLREAPDDGLLSLLPNPCTPIAPETTSVPDPVLSTKDLRRISKYVQSGHMRKASSVVRGRSSLVPVTDTVVDNLRAKHPVGSLNPFGNAPGPLPPALDDAHITTLDDCMKSLDPQSSAGISGWTPQLLQLAYGHPSECRPFRTFMFTYAKQMMVATAPGRQMMCASLMLAVAQGRPLACGELIYRVLMRFLLRLLGTENMLLPEQLGVGTSGGVEPIVELLQHELRSLNDDEDRYVYSLDLSNAFNSTPRGSIAAALRSPAAQRYFRLAKWAYNEATPLVLQKGNGLEVIQSAEGVRQGDPLGPLLFSLALKSKMDSLKQQVCTTPSDRLVAYLDDIYLISDSPDKMTDVQDIFGGGGFVLNVTKSKRTSLIDIRDGVSGYPVLGSMIGPAEARRAFFRAKVAELQPALQRLGQLPRQHALLLLRLSFAPQLRYLLRCMDLEDLQDELEELDVMVFGQLDSLRAATEAPDDAGGPPRDPKTQRVYSLPISVGGCGVYSYAETRPHAREASQRSAWSILKSMGVSDMLPAPDLNPLPTVEEERAADDNEVDDIPKQKQLSRRHFDTAVPEFLNSLSPDERVAFLDNGSKCGTAWLHALPHRSGHRSLTDYQISAALNIRCLQPDVMRNRYCQRCQNENSVLHFECCSQGVGAHVRQYRHDYIRDTLIKALRSAKLRVQPEPPINQNNHAQRADISISSAAGVRELHPRYGLVDLTIKAVLAADTVHARNHAQVPEIQVPDPNPDHRVQVPSIRQLGWAQIAAALEVPANEKRNHYATYQPYHPVFPLVIASGGTLHAEARAFLKEMFPDATTRHQICTDISIGLVRGRTQAYQLD